MRLLTDRESFVPPRDTIELTLAGIWERLLEFQPRSISITDNFFDLGGHSLIAVRMLAEIEQVFNRDISIRTLLENPTIERLAQLIRMNGRRQQADSPLVALQREGRQPPFFLVHALGGNPMLYANMVRHLGPDQPFYVLQSPAFDEQGEAVPAVGALAGQYIESLRQIQPEGPYYLGGMCEAAVVAHEMAQQLLAQDQQVAMLAIFDPPLMEHLGYRGKVINLISRFEEELGRVEGPFVNHWFQLSTLKGQARRSYLIKLVRQGRYIPGKIVRRVKYILAQRAKRRQKHAGRAIPATGGMAQPNGTGSEPPDNGLLSPLLRQKLYKEQVLEANTKVVQSYLPKQFHDKITVFVTEHGYLISRFLGWRRLARRGLRLQPVPGLHDKSLKDENAIFFAETLNNHLQAARQTGGAPGSSEEK
jgi:thioesterase domain-containing protein/acyl carrier protein